MKALLKPRQAGKTAIRIQFLDHVPIEDVNAFYETEFLGFGDVQRGETSRVLFLTKLRLSSDIVVAQLSLFQTVDQILEWEEI